MHSKSITAGDSWADAFVTNIGRCLGEELVSRVRLDVLVGKGLHHEEDLSAQPNSPPACPRLSGAYADSRGPRNSEAPSGQGPEAARGFYSVQVTVVAASSCGFPRRDRLRRSWEFRRVSRSGRPERAQKFILLISSSPDGQSSGGRLGLTVNRRVGNAVVRNRLKRQMREWFRRLRPEDKSGRDIVIIARKSAAGISTDELGATLSALLQRQELEIG